MTAEHHLSHTYTQAVQLHNMEQICFFCYHKLHLKLKPFYFIPVLGMSYNKLIPKLFLTMGQLEALHINCTHTHAYIQ